MLLHGKLLHPPTDVALGPHYLNEEVEGIEDCCSESLGLGVVLEAVAHDGLELGDRALRAFLLPVRGLLPGLSQCQHTSDIGSAAMDALPS